MATIDAGPWLVLETSGRTGSVALARGNAIVREAALDASRKHARDLAATVAKLLEAEGLRIAALAGVIVGIGPGSYTGLRVGVMSAKTLAYAAGCKLIAVPTFAAIAEQAPAEAARIGVMADALQGLVYRQRFEKVNGAWTAAEPLAIEPLAELEPWMREAGCIGGPGVSLLDAKPMPGVNCVVWSELRPASVLAAARNLAPATREELFALEPLYLRGSSAEEKAKRS